MAKVKHESVSIRIPARILLGIDQWKQDMDLSTRSAATIDMLRFAMNNRPVQIFGNIGNVDEKSVFDAIFEEIEK